MLATPGAPVAVICGSRVTMPYAMAVLGTELLGQVFENRSETLGQRSWQPNGRWSGRR